MYNKTEIITFLSTHKTELQKNYGVKRIGLCGSYARGDSRPDSDIDFVIEMESEKKISIHF